MEDYKKNRFFSYDQSSLDILQQLYLWRPLAVFRREIRDFDSVFDVYARVLPDDLKECRLTTAIRDPQEDRPCRIAEDVLCAVFYELMRNATQHGLAYIRDQADIDARRAFVDIHCARDVIEGREALILCNDADLDDPGKRLKWLAAGSFSPVADDVGRGPGLVAGVLRNLGLGNIWSAQYGDADGSPTFAVAVWLKGLRIQ